MSEVIARGARVFHAKRNQYGTAYPLNETFVYVDWDGAASFEKLSRIKITSLTVVEEEALSEVETLAKELYVTLSDDTHGLLADDPFRVWADYRRQAGVADNCDAVRSAEDNANDTVAEYGNAEWVYYAVHTLASNLDSDEYNAKGQSIETCRNCDGEILVGAGQDGHHECPPVAEDAEEAAPASLDDLGLVYPAWQPQDALRADERVVLEELGVDLTPAPIPHTNDVYTPADALELVTLALEEQGIEDPSGRAQTLLHNARRSSWDAHGRVTVHDAGLGYYRIDLAS